MQLKQTAITAVQTNKGATKEKTIDPASGPTTPPPGGKPA